MVSEQSNGLIVKEHTHFHIQSESPLKELIKLPHIRNGKCIKKKVNMNIVISLYDIFREPSVGYYLLVR